MKKLLLTLGLALGIGGAVALTPVPVAEAQIGYQNGWDGTTDLTITSDVTNSGSYTQSAGSIKLNDGIPIIFGSDSDFDMDYQNGTNAWNITDDGDSLGYSFVASLTDASTATGMEFVIDTGIAATQTVRAVAIDMENANHTGAATIYGLQIDAITGDADSTEVALAIGDGWDQEIDFDGSTAVINTDTSLRLDSDSADATWLMSVANGQRFQLRGRATGTSSQSFLEINPTEVAMDGSDTITWFDIDGAMANHTSTGNTVNVLRIDDLTGDAETNLNGILVGTLTGTAGSNNELEIAVNIGGGWDRDISFANTDAQIAFPNTGAITFFDDGNNTDIVVITDSSSATGGILRTSSNGLGNGGSHISAGSGFDFTAQDGSDLAAFFRVDGFTDALHTSTGNDIIAFHAETITTPDADSTHSLLGGEGGWDYLIWNNAALGTDAWTTATDKTANTKAGTLKVEINGTLYHIQLYTDI
jgi:hypothetical protein